MITADQARENVKNGYSVKKINRIMDLLSDKIEECSGRGDKRYDFSAFSLNINIREKEFEQIVIELEKLGFKASIFKSEAFQPGIYEIIVKVRWD